MDSEGQQLHIIIFPFLPSGHLLPAVDVARLLAAAGVRVSLVTTAYHAPAIEASLHRLVEFGRPVDILLVESSSSAKIHLDNLSSASSADADMDNLIATLSFRPSFERLVKRHRPAAMITDKFYPWTVEVAEEVGIPRLVFHGTSFFCFRIEDELLHGRTCPDIHRVNADRFAFPGLPHRIELSRSQLPNPKEMTADFVDMFAKVNEAEKRSYGVVVNSFYELEPDYADHYMQVMGRKAWHIGPVFLHDDTKIDHALRGGKSAESQDSLLRWLDSKPTRSVLYVSFGSLSRFTKIQLREIAAGLKSSGHPFIWVVRNSGVGDLSGQWLPEGLQEEVAEFGMGMIIQGWAPQLLILNHPAVGGFLTHCGWNSCLESIAAGLPVATWPIFADQFFNERMLVDVLKVGVEIGVKTNSMREDTRELIKADDIAATVVRLMEKDLEAEERRRRVRELQVAARRAVEEGGSSRKDLRRLIQELWEMQYTVV